ncbi:MAG: DUF126 domain-containing protein [Acidobacteria bacterium]|nr:MAG: DUF126 domain-containing protein [Acidobacteriota bacterium]
MRAGEAPPGTRLFEGRPVLPGDATGLAEVSTVPFDTCATYVDLLISGARSGRCRDISNPDLYGRDLVGRILCIPQTIGSMSATTLWMTLIESGLAPAALCLANPIDATAASGLVLAEHWLGSRPVAVDCLGPEFLDTARTGDTVAILEDGSVEIRPREPDL